MVKFGRKIGKKTKQLKAIKWYVSRDFTSRQIQAKLKERNLGLRRKTLLHEIRLIKGVKVSEEKRRKAIPKKYRKPEPKIKKWIDRVELDKIFRVSYIMQDIPVHSRPFNRNYLGFRLQAFSLDKEYLYQQDGFLRRLLLKLANEYLRFDAMENFNWNHKVLGIEKPTLINISNANRFHNIWIFRVEQEGSEIYSKDGRI